MNPAPPRSIPLDPWDAAVRWRWYTTRLAKGAPEIACELRIVDGDRDPDTGELMSDQLLVALVDGNRQDFGNGWPIGWPWKPVDRLTFRTRLEQAAWARNYAPQDPLANPHRRPDLSRAPLPF